MKSRRMLVIEVEDGEEEKTVLHALLQAAHDLEDDSSPVSRNSINANINLAMSATEHPFLIETVGFVSVSLSIQHPRENTFYIEENLYHRERGRSFYEVTARARELLDDWKAVPTTE